jgi:glycosyltransferase involved in cell wall biosynthesis
MSKPRILWSGDIVARTGFARVTENLITRLKDKYEIVVLGNNWWGDPNPFQEDFKMFPSSNRFATEPFGVQRIREITERVKPDIVFVNNDAWIVNQIYDQIREFHEQKLFKFVAYMPMDSYGWTGCLNQFSNAWDGIYVYTKFGAEEFKLSGINKEVGVIPHGITDGQFFPMDKTEVRKKLSIPEDCFVVFNGNRNQARKRIDITIDAFAQFAVGRPDTKLYLHMGLKDQGWDVMPLFGREMRKRGMDPNGRIIMSTQGPQPPAVPVEMLNMIYNSADVSVNTCKGEGHGLVNHESAACGVAQVVPNHTSLKEIFEGAAPLIDNCFMDVDMNYNRDMPVPSAEHLAEILTDLYEDRDLLKQVGADCFQRATSAQYQWDNIAKQFEEAFDKVLQPEEVEKPQIKRRKRKPKKELSMVNQ